MNCAAMHILVHVSCDTCASVSWIGTVRLLETECSVLQENYKLFLNGSCQFIFLPVMCRRFSRSTYSTTHGSFFICADRMCVKWYFIMVFICISLITKKIKVFAVLFTGVSFLWTACLCLLLIFLFVWKSFPLQFFIYYWY